MGDTTHIQWTDATWNPIAGCSVHSPGCTNCYAMKLSGTRLATHPMYAGTTSPSKNGPVFNGHLTEAAPDHPVWDWPLRFRGPKVTKRGPGHKALVFVGDMSDIAHKDRPRATIDKMFARMALAKHLEFQVLTKRPDVLRDYIVDPETPDRLDHLMDEIAPAHWCDRETETWPLPNVWVGTSVEDQRRAEERIPALLDTPAAIRFISAEPLLGDLDLSNVGYRGSSKFFINALDGYQDETTGRSLLTKLDWVIVGGESGDGARESVIGYQRSVVQQCRSAGVAVFQKQLGSRPVNREGQPHRLTDRKGGTMEEWPEDLRVRQWPERVAA